MIFSIVSQGPFQQNIECLPFINCEEFTQSYQMKIKLIKTQVPHIRISYQLPFLILSPNPAQHLVFGFVLLTVNLMKSSLSFTVIVSTSSRNINTKYFLFQINIFTSLMALPCWLSWDELLFNLKFQTGFR